MKRISVTIAILFLFLAIFKSSFLYAGMGISPVRVETSAEIGKETTGYFQVRNTGENPVNVSISFEDWLGKGIEPGTWIKFEPENFSIGPKETREVRYIINMPEGASGEYAIRVFFSGREEGAFVGTGLGVHIYAMVKGTEKIEAEIKEFTVKYDPSEGISGSVLIENKGNVHIRPITVISVLDMEDRQIINFSVPSDNPVHVMSSRAYSFNNKVPGLVDGRYKVIARTDYGSLYKRDIKAIKETELVVEGLAGEEGEEAAISESPPCTQEQGEGTKMESGI